MELSLSTTLTIMNCEWNCQVHALFRHVVGNQKPVQEAAHGDPDHAVLLVHSPRGAGTADRDGHPAGKLCDDVTLRLGAKFTASAYRVFDQFGSQDTPIALL